MGQERVVQREILRVCWDMGLPVFHVANGGRRDSEEARALYFDGVTRGVPDICIPVAFTHPLSGVAYSQTWVEVKSCALDARLTADQEGWCDWLRSQGHYVIAGERGAGPVIDELVRIYRPRPMPAFYVAARTLKPRAPKPPRS